MFMGFLVLVLQAGGNLRTLLYVHLTLLCFTINLGASVNDSCKVFLV
jgi:hypothetical protein